MADDALKVANAAKALSEQNEGWINRNGKTLQEFMDKVAKRINELEDGIKKLQDENKTSAKTITGLQKDLNALKKKK